MFHKKNGISDDYVKRIEYLKECLLDREANIGLAN